MLLVFHVLEVKCFFDDCYNVNPLVNAFSAGIVKAGETVSATSYGLWASPVFTCWVSYR